MKTQTLTLWLLLGTAGVGFAQTEQKEKPKSPATSEISSTYLNLMKPIDIFSLPPNAKKLLTLKDLYSLVKTQGVTLKVAEEDLNQANQTQRRYRDAYLPTLNLTVSNNNTWTQTKEDGDLGDDYSDRSAMSSSFVTSHGFGLGLSGSLMPGVTYSLNGPAYSRSRDYPEEGDPRPRRRENAAWNAEIGVDLLKESPIFVRSLKKQIERLELTSAKEAFRAATLNALQTAEGSYFELIKRYLSLMIVQRSFDLAKSLEAEVKEKIIAGEASEIDAMRASLQSATSETELMTAEIDYQRSVEDFRNSLSYDDNKGEGIFPDPRALDIDVSKLVLPPATAIKSIQSQNPDVIRAKLADRTSSLDVELARTGTYPSLKLTTNYSNKTPGESFSETLGQSFLPNDRTFGIGLTYTQVLYNNGAKNELLQKIVTRQKSALNIDQAEKNVVKTFNSLLKRLEIGAKRLEIAKTSRIIAEKKLQSEFEKFKYGESSVRNVIDSQSEVNSARITEIDARVNMLLGHGELRTLSGKLPEGVTIQQNESGAP